MRILHCDDHAMFAEAFASLLNRRGHEVVGVLGSPLEIEPYFVRSSAAALSLDVMVMEVAFPELPQGSAVATVRHVLPSLPIAVLTGEAEVTKLRKALEEGADGVALKTESVNEVERLLIRITSPLFQKLRQTSQPEKAWSRQTRALAGRAVPRVGEMVTPRELTVVELVALGQSTVTIAQQMHVSVPTVRTHLQHLFMKFGVHSRLELVAFAIRSGLVNPQSGSTQLRDLAGGPRGDADGPASARVQEASCMPRRAPA
jgi:DNA-binding NarL/FixJ family response regulator